MPPTEYQVVSGDTLSGLAERFYGDGSLFPVISVVNHLADPDQIDVGQELLILWGDTTNHAERADVVSDSGGAGQRSAARITDLGLGTYSLPPILIASVCVLIDL